MKLNIGCSYKPIPGWVNCDNSLTLKISKIPFLATILFKTNLISKKRYDYLKTMREMSVRSIDAKKKLPFQNCSVDSIYISHVLNCFSRNEAIGFLKEAHRVLTPGGVIRISVPDLSKKINIYLKNKNADEFIDSIYARRLESNSFIKRIEQILSGNKLYLAQDNFSSLEKMLTTASFTNIYELKPGQTHIQNYGALDLTEHSEESIYVEAIK